MNFAGLTVRAEKMQLCDEILEACKSNFEGLIGVLGFCWGAKCATLLSGDHLHRGHTLHYRLGIQTVVTPPQAGLPMHHCRCCLKVTMMLSMKI